MTELERRLCAALLEIEFVGDGTERCPFCSSSSSPLDRHNSGCVMRTVRALLGLPERG